MGAGRVIMAIWGAEDYKPTLLLDVDYLSQSLGGLRRSESADRLRRVWIGMAIASTYPGIGTLSPALSVEGYEAQVSDRVGTATKPRQQWEELRHILVEHGLPDPGPGKLLIVEAYD